MRRRVGALSASFAFHVVVVVWAAWLTSTLPVPRAPQRVARSIAVFAVPPSNDEAAPPGLNPIDPDDDVIGSHAGSPTLALATFTLSLAKIARGATLLFPFLTPGLALERFSIAPEPRLHDAFNDPTAPQRDAPARPNRGRRPLALSDSAMQSLLDRSWSRRDRWTPFQQIAKLAEMHDPDAGKLPALLHAYHRQNGLQPYVDTSIRDPRLWTELGLAADHAPFIGFISAFASEHRSTKATTELLFLLDQIAQANMDALLTLMDTDPAASLAWTREANADAYALIVELRRHYAKQLQRKGLTSREAITAYYDRVRLGVLTGILRTTPRGYRASDARFLIGAIDWRHGNAGDALRAWRAMTVDPTDAYAASIAQLLRVIAAETGGDRGNVDARDVRRLLAQQVEGILRAEHGRWIMFSLDRLRQFGFHFDTF